MSSLHRVDSFSMRLFSIAALTFSVGSAWCQSTPDSKLDATFIVTLHKTGAQMIEVTLLDGNYPADVLQSELLDFGKRLGSDPRGLQIFRTALRSDDPSLSFVKAKFAVDGLMDPLQGTFRLAPIAQAFAQSPATNRIKNILVTFADQKFGPKTLQKFDSPFVQVRGRFNEDPKGLEYFIQITTDDPSKLTIPDSYEAPQVAAPSKPKKEGSNVWFLATVVVAGVSFGALVYLALVRTSARTRR